MISFGAGAFCLVLAFMLIVSYGVFWVWDQDVKRKAYLERAYIVIGNGDTLSCGLLRYETRFTNGENKFVCEGAKIVDMEVVINEKVN